MIQLASRRNRNNTETGLRTLPSPARTRRAIALALALVSGGCGDTIPNPFNTVPVYDAAAQDNSPADTLDNPRSDVTAEIQTLSDGNSSEPTADVHPDTNLDAEPTNDRADIGSVDGSDGGIDVAVDGSADATVDGGIDAAVDGSADATVDGDADATVDGGLEAAVDGDADATVDGGLEAAVDGSAEAAVDGGLEAAVDGSAEAAVDGGIDAAAVDGSADATVDGGLEAAVDGGADAGVDSGTVTQITYNSDFFPSCNRVIVEGIAGCAPGAPSCEYRLSSGNCIRYVAERVTIPSSGVTSIGYNFSQMLRGALLQSFPVPSTPCLVPSVSPSTYTTRLDVVMNRTFTMSCFGPTIRVVP